MKVTDLSERMKGYEKVFDTKVPNRMPIIIRLDGKAFHTFTKTMEKPFDINFMKAMIEAMRYVCKNIQTTVFGYVQSDEISLLLFNYNTFESQPLFNNRIQKLTSISAATVTAFLNSYLKLPLNNLQKFDARVFVLPEKEVVNYFLWRQQDAETNSINMLAQSLYSHKELQNKNNLQLKELCFKKGNDWNDLETYKKRGTCTYKNVDAKYDNELSEFDNWIIDIEIPIFSQDRDYINKWIIPKEE